MSLAKRGPEWHGWEDINEPQPLEWQQTAMGGGWVDECFIKDHLVAWIEPRPHYCDRGHYVVKTELPRIDTADSFPRYYMHHEIAKLETEDWLRWRLWGFRGE